MYVLITVVSLAVLIMLGINLYYMLKSRRNMQSTAVLHQRLDEMAEVIKNQMEQHHKLAKLVSDLNLDKDKK